MAEEAKNKEPINQNPEPAPSPEPDIESRLQQMMVENAKLKKAFDKSASEAAEWKKKYNATLTEKEQMDQEKAEKEAEREEMFEQLKRENTINKNEKNYLALGYPPEMANKAAVAQADNDFDTLYKLQQDVMSQKLKDQEAEWLKNRPDFSAGGKEEDEDMFTKGFMSEMKKR